MGADAPDLTAISPDAGGQVMPSKPGAPTPTVPPGVLQPKVTTGKAQISEKLQARYDRAIKAFSDAEPYYKTMFGLLDETISGKPLSATRSEMIRVLRAKVLDPISVVREGEVFRSDLLLGFKDQINQLLMRLESAKDFTPEQATQVKNEMQELFQNMQAWKQMQEGYFQAQAEALGLKFIQQQPGAAPATSGTPGRKRFKFDAQGNKVEVK
jgi:hypothetical protein